MHHVRIQDAKLHYHARTDEFYYIIDGQGNDTTTWAAQVIGDPVHLIEE